MGFRRHCWRDLAGVSIFGAKSRVGLNTHVRPLATAAANVFTPKLIEVPNDPNTPFQVPLGKGSFESYLLDDDPPPNTFTVTKRELKKLYHNMFKIRRLEMAADRLYKEQKIRGFCHLSIGQEAVAAGIEHSITHDDKFITAYRCHGNALMRGISVRQIIGEVLGRRDGVCHGKGGSVHMFSKNFFGGHGIVGATVPIGAGLAFAQQYEDTGNVTVALYGDGAANQGQVFEAFNIAQLWKLPVIFGCENNKFGMATSAERSSAMTEYYKRGQYIPGLRIDGMDVLAVAAATLFGKKYTTIDAKGPLVFEYVTYRYFGHSVSDPGTSYRSRDEVRQMRESADPLTTYQRKLVEWDIVTKEELTAMESEIRADVDKEVEQAEAMSHPETIPDILYEDSYVPGSEPRWVRGRTIHETHYY